MSTEAPPTARPRWWLTPAKYALGVAVLGYVLQSHWHAPPDAPGTGLVDALTGPKNYAAMTLAALCMIPGIVFTLVRWWGLARALDLPLSLFEATRLGLLGYFFNTLLPGGIGGDAIKIAAVVRSQDRRTAAVASILFDRAVGLGGQVVLVAAFGAGFWLFDDPVLDNQNLFTIVWLSWLVLSVVSVGWLCPGWLPVGRAERLAVWLRTIPKVGNVFAELCRAVWTYRRRPAAVAVAMGLSVLNHLGSVLAFHFASRIFVTETDVLPTLSQHYLIAPVGQAVKAVWPAPGGAGGGELTFGGLYVLAGSTKVRGVLTSLASLVLTALLGFVAYAVALVMGAKPTLPAEAVELNRPSG